MKIKSIGRSKFLPLVISGCLMLASVMPFGIAGVFAADETFSWTKASGYVSVSGNNSEPDSITATASANASLYEGDKFVVFDYLIKPSAQVDDGNILIDVRDCGFMADDDSVEVYKVVDNTCENVTSDLQVSDNELSFIADGFGEYFAVSNVATVDLAMGNVVADYDTISGTRMDGTAVKYNFLENGKKYHISQYHTDVRNDYRVTFKVTQDFDEFRTLIIDGINTSNQIVASAKNYKAKIKLQLRNVNQVFHIGYGSTTTESNFTIENYGDVSGTSGELYVPYKMNTREEELEYVYQGAGVNFWANAGIGGDYNVGAECKGLNIAGGTIKVITQTKNSATAIGAGGNADAQINITGGNITAISSSTGSAIGGGIGWLYRGGIADISITGGTVYAENVKYYTRDTTSYGGVAIGSGSSMEQYGSEAKIHIGGDSKVTAYARYGNGIGSGNAYQGTAAQADITIDDNAVVTTNALGGGTSKENQGGSANINVDDNAVVNCVKYSEIEDKYDESTENVLGAFGIGGGNSAGDNKGGSATVNVYGGELNCNGGKIGGGNSDSGDGGDASIYVSGGTLKCSSVGGGNSETGSPGSVTSKTQDAGVVVSGGTVTSGYIGGGTNNNGDIGFATAKVTGGNIQGQFVLSNTDTSKKCFFDMSGGTIDNTFLDTDGYDRAQDNGGAVFLDDPNGTVNISGGTIQNCKAFLGGAVYMSTGQFTLSGTGTIQNCSAYISSKDMSGNGGAVFNGGGTVNVNGGNIINNTAELDGAGIYLANGDVIASGGNITNNKATNNGGGAYLSGTSTFTVSGGTISDNTAVDGAGMYLANGQVTVKSGYIKNNTADNNGAGVYVDKGNIEVAGGNVTENKSISGAGMYLSNGLLTVTGGNFTNNIAQTNGGGAYLSTGSNLIISGGTFSQNTAVNGAGMYLSNGLLTANGGSITDNTASANGGGAYLGTGSNIVVNDGSFSRNNAINGGGVYIADGTVRMYGGTVGFNKSTKDGGGIYVSASSTPADVVIRSGSIVNNTAGSKSAPANGGGIAVESGGSPTADVITIGLLETHKDLQVSTHTFTPFDYEEEYDGKKVHNHASCPILENNVAYASGGGIYMGSNLATLNIYCMLEDKNTAHAGDESDGVMSVGGTINIGDHENNNPNARGNVIVNSPMFVSGGDVTVSGNMDNPYFKNNVLVDIKNNSGSFKDNRYYIESAKEYKVHYFENFKGDSDTASGVYKVLQYNQDATIYAEGAMYIHEGWRILEWNTEPDGTGTQYKIGSTIASSSDHTAWGKNDNDPLVLYAIWTRNTYTVKYEPNANEYTGSMANEVFEYNVEKRLSENKYKVSGMRFVGWNTMSDGSGTAYSSNYSESKLSKVNGSTVTLYAQWVKCTHKGGDHPGTLSYTVSGNSLTESCDCGGYTVTATLRAADAYHDGKTHPATLNLTGTFLAGNPTVSYVYSETEDGTFGALANGETLPTSTGWYIASITVEGKTVSVKYQIKSPTEGLAQEAKAVAKQVFSDFNGETKPSVQQDDSFTTEFTVRNLNAETFTVAPVLSFSASLPSGTSIIMQTGGKYWYLNDATGKSIDLTSFTQMGTDTKFAYTFDANQNYRFIIDFSKAGSYLSGDLTVNLTYEYLNNPDDSVVLSTAVSLKSKENFALSYTNGALTITAPQSDNYYRYNNRELVLVLNSTNLPSDARIVASAGDKTKIYYINQNGDIIIPIVWAQTRQISLKFVSDFANQQGKNYTFNIAECVGADPNGSSDTAAVEYCTGVTAQATIDVDDKVEPSLKIEGAQRLLKSTDTLSLDITTKNVDGYTLSATIQKKNGDDYDGNFLSTDIKDGKNEFSLSSIKTEGSYRVLVSVISSDGTTVLTVPYYFIVL